MSKTRRRPVNHGKHTDPASIRRRNEISTDRPRSENAAPAPESAPAPGSAPAVTRRRRIVTPPAGTTRPDPPVADERPAAPEELPPWSTAGDYLRAAATDDAPVRFGTPPGPVDDYARRVWQAAFGLAVRQRFEPASPLAEISRTVATAVHTHESAALPAIDVEMLVRAELGEQVPVGELDPGMLIDVHLLVFASLVDELALGDGELDDLVTQAERFAAGG